MKIAEANFLKTHADCWAARQAPEFSVVNVHATEISAPAARIYPQLSSRELLIPGPFWRFLIGLRFAIGKICGWDHGIAHDRPQAFEPGQYFAFFHVKYVEAPREVGMEAENRLTRALMSWLLEEKAGRTAVFNVTCANCKGWRGRLYWRVIRPFHDGLIEDSLRLLRRRVAVELD